MKKGILTIDEGKSGYKIVATYVEENIGEIRRTHDFSYEGLVHNILNRCGPNSRATHKIKFGERVNLNSEQKRVLERIVLRGNIYTLLKLANT